ncbi:low temperature requirement protein A [Kribbella sandramycini]|nr:low temperature requirement protein A [Kribbella sandramycini]NOL39055.1 low temperature requirement protein A [Kribbella sandramycini]
MTARPIDEPHRTASPLELLFDLTFVVAVAAVTAEFAHSIADGHPDVLGFFQVFFAIWWAWMNFTWFASSYDTDDVPYRLLTMVQMAGVLVLAAGVHAAASSGDYRIVLAGYLLMRVGLIAQWLRAAYEDVERRRTALKYAVGIAVTQIGWALALVVLDLSLPSFVVLVVLELAVPRWAEHSTVTTNWHPHHIAERYGLFAIILLGESVLAASRGVQAAVEADQVGGAFILVAGAGLVLLFALWWLYFLHPSGEGLSERRAHSYSWGYGHYFLFAALAALGGGLEVAVEETTHASQAVGYAVALPVAVFLTMLWLVHAPIVSPPVTPLILVLISVTVVLMLPLVLSAVGVVLGCAAVVVLLVAAVLSRRGRRPA